MSCGGNSALEGGEKTTSTDNNELDRTAMEGYTIAAVGSTHGINDN